MFRKYYKNNTLATHRPTLKVATCQILSSKTKSIWRTNFSKFNNHIWNVRVKWIHYRVLPKRRTFSSHQNYRDGDKFSFSRTLSDGEFQLTDPRSAKILDKVVE